MWCCLDDAGQLHRSLGRKRIEVIKDEQVRTMPTYGRLEVVEKVINPDNPDYRLVGAALSGKSVLILSQLCHELTLSYQSYELYLYERN